MRQLRVLVLFRFPPSVGAKEVIAAGARILLPEQRRGKAFLSFRAAFGGGLVEGAKPATVDENLNESVRSCGRERSLAIDSLPWRLLGARSPRIVPHQPGCGLVPFGLRASSRDTLVRCGAF